LVGSKPNKNKTLHEYWTGYKPNVAHLRVFGSVGYVHVPDQMRAKLDDKSMKLIFIGYDERSKAYKLYNPIQKKVISSRDVYKISKVVGTGRSKKSSR
jgi:hypothetical protein